MVPGCAPSGEVTFVSRGYGGNTTDAQIVQESGLLGLVEAGDIILADKGFPTVHNMLQEHGSSLIVPPFKVGNIQFDPTTVLGKGCEGTFVYK